MVEQVGRPAPPNGLLTVATFRPLTVVGLLPQVFMLLHKSC
eukprot:COSAG01_NODE_47740_length_387_cov_1.177083_1_plen_40_part_10